MKGWTRDQIIAIAGLLVAIVACIADLVVVPEVRRWFGLESSTTPPPVDTVVPVSPTQPPTQTNIPPTLIPSATLPPTSEPSNTSLPTPTCPTVNAPFATVWTSVQEKVGCPTGNTISGLVAEENFERGKMFMLRLLCYSTMEGGEYTNTLPMSRVVQNSRVLMPLRQPNAHQRLNAVSV